MATPSHLAAILLVLAMAATSCQESDPPHGCPEGTVIEGDVALTSDEELRTICAITGTLEIESPSLRNARLYELLYAGGIEVRAYELTNIEMPRLESVGDGGISVHDTELESLELPALVDG